MANAKDTDFRCATHRCIAALAACAALQFVFAAPGVAQTFDDVPPGYWAAPFVENIAANGITGGCGGSNYCPSDVVTRAQMAVFLERGMRGGNFVPPPASGLRFNDIEAGTFAAAFIEQLANDGITSGCGGGNYCPDSLVTRAQMAVFLLRAKHGAGYVPPAATGVFNDVDTGYWASAWIEQLAAEGVSSGCGGGSFCPDDPVTRDQMAVFLVRTFGLVDPNAYVGPAARDAEVLSFQQEFWEYVRRSDRCGGCHNAAIGQVPLFARKDDVNLAYDATLPFIDEVNPASSVMATKVGSGHNCWLADSNACATVMTTWIENWLFGDANLTLSGVSMELATVTATVYAAGSNGSSSTTFSTTADGDGAFTLPVTTAAPDDFVVLTSVGAGADQGVELISQLGDAEFLEGLTGGSVISVADYGALEISYVSTALAVLADRANGAPIAGADELVAAQANVHGAPLLDMATAIKAYADNEQISLPPGFDTILEVVRDPLVYDGFLDDIEANHPQPFAVAMSNITFDLADGYEAADVAGTTYAVLRDVVPHYPGSIALTLDAGGGGDVALIEGASDVSWTIDAEGMLIVDLLNPPAVESTAFDPETGLPIRALTRTERVTMTRIADGIGGDQVVVLERTVTEYPDNPELPDEVVDDTIAAETILFAFAADQADPFDAADFAGKTVVTNYYHQGNNTPSSIDPRVGADFLTFNANGTGISTRRLLTFVWTIDADGAAVVRFANNDETRIVRFGREGVATQTLIVGDLADGSSRTYTGEVVEYDGASEFTEGMLTNRRYRAAWSYNEDYDYDFLFLPGGSGCRITAGLPRVLDWLSTPGNLMDLRLYLPDQPTVPWQRRSWELVAIETGLYGDRYWVLETVETNNAQDPDYSFADPAVMPGRLNTYEYVQNLLGVTNPCGF